MASILYIYEAANVRYIYVDTLGKRQAMENHVVKSTDHEEVGNWMKLSRVWIFFIVPEISLFAFKYRPGENPIYQADHVVVFGLLGWSLIVYITTLAVLSMMKTPKPNTNTSRLPILLIFHVCWSCGALACGILSSLLFLYGWLMLCFYTLFLWSAPCKPLTNLPRLRQPSNTEQQHHHHHHLDSIVVELPAVLHPAPSTVNVLQEYSNSNADEGLENPLVWKYI